MRIYITGMGVVSPLGNSVQAYWEALCAGKNGMRSLTRFDPAQYPFQRGGQVADDFFSSSLQSVLSEQIDLATRFVFGAVEQAVGQAGLDEVEPQDDRGSRPTAIILGTNFGGMASGERVLEEQAEGEMHTPFSEYWFQSAADHLAACFPCTGPRHVISLSCASGGAALAYGADLIRAGHADRVITAGYDALSRFAWSGLGALRTMTKDEVRPFDANRSGTIFSEGAACLVLERADVTEQRGADGLAELSGYAVNNNAFHMTAPSRGGAGSAQVMQDALTHAGIEPEKVDHINAHGTGTKPNDVTEAQAFYTVFGERAGRIPVTSIKSMTGHMMGAAASAEAVAAVQSLRDNTIPPTINVSEPDPECNVDVVTGSARECENRVVLSNSAGIGGCNAAVVLQKT